MKTKNPFAKQKVRKYKVLILTLFFFSFSVTCTQILAQDSLARYSLAELDTLYKHTKIPQDKLPYALAMLKTGEKQFNKQDTSYAKILFKVRNTYGRIRDFKNATIYLQKAIDIQKTKATNTSAYANSLNNLGMVYYYQFKLEKVENLWLEAMRIRKEILGKKHPDYATSLDLLGLLYKNLGDYEKAEIFIIQSFNIRKEILDKKHPDYANSLNNLGNLYAELGNYKKAELLYIEALNLKKEFDYLI